MTISARFFLVFLLLLAACEAMSASAAPDTQPEQNIAAGYVEVFDESALAILNPDPRVFVRASGYRWTEGPLWVEDGHYLLFSDIPNNVVLKYVPGVGTTTYLNESGATGLKDGDYGQGSNGLLLNGDGKLVLLQQGDRRVAAMRSELGTPKSEFDTLAGAYDGLRLNSPNDGVFGSDGSLYFTDPPYGLAKGADDERMELSFHGIYRLDPDGTLLLLDGSVDYPNGIGLSVDETVLYVAVSDSENPVWLAYDLLPDGAVDNRRVFYDATAAKAEPGGHGYPDGMAVHSSGAVFATGPGGVWLFSPDGRVLAMIHTDRATANCTLSSDERTLFLTATDTLMSLKLQPRSGE
ncbi:MAG: SMP-30/gluconolactonase/LRE family protein [Pseudomonadota bacterium]